VESYGRSRLRPRKRKGQGKEVYQRAGRGEGRSNKMAAIGGRRPRKKERDLNCDRRSSLSEMKLRKVPEGGAKTES